MSPLTTSIIFNSFANHLGIFHKVLLFLIRWQEIDCANRIHCGFLERKFIKFMLL